jgi:outer membrane protein assembly factor BamB
MRLPSLERYRLRIIRGAFVVLAAAMVLACYGSPSPEDTSSTEVNPATRPGDAAMFGGTPQRNMANTVEKNIPAEWSIQEGKQKNIKWVAKIGSTSYGGPVVAGGKVYVGTNNEAPRDPQVKGDKGIVMCFRAADGTFLWQAVHEFPRTIDQEARNQGIASTPVIEGDRVYYVSNASEVICASTQGLTNGVNLGVQDEKFKGPKDADIIWRLDMIKDLDVYPHKLSNCSPLIAGDLVFVTTGNGPDEEKVRNPQAPSFIAVNKKTGQLVWKDNSPGETIPSGQWSNPAYAVVDGKAQVIFAGGDGWLRGFEAQTGKPLWKFDCNPKSAQAKKGDRNWNYLVATPVVYDNKVFVGVGQEPSAGTGVGHLWCVDITKTGDLSPVKDNWDPTDPVNKNSGLVWHYGGEADKKTAEEIGRDFLFGRTISTVAIHDGLLYAAELTGYLHCLDVKTGRRYWDHDLKAEVWGSPYYVDGRVYIGTGDGDVHVFAHGKEKKILGKMEMEDSIYSTPVAAHGVLYVMTTKRLFAIAAQ